MRGILMFAVLCVFGLFLETFATQPLVVQRQGLFRRNLAVVQPVHEVQLQAVQVQKVRVQPVRVQQVQQVQQVYTAPIVQQVRVPVQQVRVQQVQVPVYAQQIQVQRVQAGCSEFFN